MLSLPLIILIILVMFVSVAIDRRFIRKKKKDNSERN